MKYLRTKWLNNKETKYQVVDNFGTKQQVLCNGVQRTIAYYELVGNTTLVVVKINSKIHKFDINDCTVL
jgi:hypothetical protein